MSKKRSTEELLKSKEIKKNKTTEEYVDEIKNQFKTITKKINNNVELYKEFKKNYYKFVFGDKDNKDKYLNYYSNNNNLYNNIPKYDEKNWMKNLYAFKNNLKDKELKNIIEEVLYLENYKFEINFIIVSNLLYNYDKSPYDLIKLKIYDKLNIIDKIVIVYTILSQKDSDNKYFNLCKYCSLAIINSNNEEPTMRIFFDHLMENLEAIHKNEDFDDNIYGLKPINIGNVNFIDYIKEKCVRAKLKAYERPVLYGGSLINVDIDLGDDKMTIDLKKEHNDYTKNLISTSKYGREHFFDLYFRTANMLVGFINEESVVKFITKQDVEYFKIFGNGYQPTFKHGNFWKVFDNVVSGVTLLYDDSETKIDEIIIKNTNNTMLLKWIKTLSIRHYINQHLNDNQNIKFKIKVLQQCYYYYSKKNKIDTSILNNSSKDQRTHLILLSQCSDENFSDLTKSIWVDNDVMKSEEFAYVCCFHVFLQNNNIDKYNEIYLMVPDKYIALLSNIPKIFDFINIKFTTEDKDKYKTIIINKYTNFLIDVFENKNTKLDFSTLGVEEIYKREKPTSVISALSNIELKKGFKPPPFAELREIKQEEIKDDDTTAYAYITNNITNDNDSAKKIAISIYNDYYKKILDQYAELTGYLRDDDIASLIDNNFLSYLEKLYTKSEFREKFIIPIYNNIYPDGKIEDRRKYLKNYKKYSFLLQVFKLGWKSGFLKTTFLNIIKNLEDDDKDADEISKLIMKIWSKKEVSVILIENGITI